MSFKKRLVALCLSAVMMASLTGCGASGTASVNGEKAASNVPKERLETLYVTGMAWGAPDNFNWLTGYPTWPCNIQSNPLVYEMLFMFNPGNEVLEPLLGKSYTWKDDYTVEVKLNEKAKFNDGQSLTAKDVLYTFDLGKRYTVTWSSYWENIKSIEAPDDYTVVFKLNPEKYNRLAMLDALSRVPIHPKHIWEKVEADANREISKINEFFNEKPVGSGPYKVKFYDETRIIIERDDNYWGKELFGSLPQPKFITHLLFNSNDSASSALKNGDLDYSEDFIPSVWKLWEDGTPIKAYLPEKPYYTPDTLPMIYFNLHKKGLDNVEVRKALAYAINYPEISDKAMNGYSVVIEPSITITKNHEGQYVDEAALKPLQWSYDINKANEILDNLGAKKAADGIRVMPDGTRLGPWQLECPYGWTDWNASLEIVMQSAKAVGIELQTKFPEYPVWDNDRNTGNFDLLMDTPSAYITPANPWKRAADVMSSVGVKPVGEQTFSNYGRYKNARADEIIKQIPQTEDKAALKLLYTELNKIYLTDIPTIPLMYRPTYFYTVNEKVWKGFAIDGNKENIPPALFDGTGIKQLYNIKSN